MNLTPTAPGVFDPGPAPPEPKAEPEPTPTKPQEDFRAKCLRREAEEKAKQAPVYPYGWPFPYEETDPCSE